MLNLNPEIETADSADLADFEGVIGDEPTNLFPAKTQGIATHNLLYPCNPRNLRLNPFSVFGLNEPQPNGSSHGGHGEHGLAKRVLRSLKLHDLDLKEVVNATRG